MSNIQIETGYQLLTRLCTRPSIENIYPDIFINGGPFHQQTIEITGNSSCGKTFLITEIIAKCILPESFHNIQTGCKNAGAVLINTDHHFNILTLVNIMKNVLKSCKLKISSQQTDVIVRESLSNLVVLNCYDSQQLYLTIHNLENILTNNHKLSLIILDSISSYYWTDRISGGILKVDTYLKTILKVLQNMTKDYKMIIIYTKITHMLSKGDNIEECCNISTAGKVNYKIYLEKIYGEEQKFLANITLPDNTTIQKCFKISDMINWG